MENGNDPIRNSHDIDNQLSTNQFRSATLNPSVMMGKQISNKFDYPIEEYKIISHFWESNINNLAQFEGLIKEIERPFMENNLSSYCAPNEIFPQIQGDGLFPERIASNEEKESG